MQVNELQEVKRAPEVIVAEIRTLNRSQLSTWLEIGRRLCELKESVPYGEFGTWLSRAEYKPAKANNLMRLYREFAAPQGSLFGTEAEDFQTYGKLGFSQAVALLDSGMAAAEREEFLAENDVENMSVRQLKEALRERDEARAAAEEAEGRAKDFEGDNRELAARLRQKEERVRELESAPKEVYRDEEAIRAAADEAKKAADAAWAEKLKAAEDKLARAEEKAKKAAEKAKSAGEGKESAAELEAARAAAEQARAEAEQLRKQLEAAKKEAARAAINSDADAVLCREYYSVAVEAINKLNGHLLKCEDEQTGERIRRLLADIAKKAGGESHE